MKDHILKATLADYAFSIRHAVWLRNQEHKEQAGDRLSKTDWSAFSDVLMKAVAEDKLVRTEVVDSFGALEYCRINNLNCDTGTMLGSGWYDMHITLAPGVEAGIQVPYTHNLKQFV